MEDLKRQVFYLQIDLQCKIADRAYADLTNTSSGDCVTTFYFLQTFVSAVANISKLLSVSGTRAERQALRDELGISVEALDAARKVRNRFDHLDEDLDKWWTESPTKNFIDLNIAPNGSINSPYSGDYFRSYDPVSVVLSAYDGACVNVSEVHKAVQMIQVATRAAQRRIRDEQIGKIRRQVQHQA